MQKTDVRTLLEAIMRRRTETLQLPMLKVTHHIANKVVNMDWLAASDSSRWVHSMGLLRPQSKEQKSIQDCTRKWTDHHNSSTNPTIAKTRIAMQEGNWSQ